MTKVTKSSDPEYTDLKTKVISANTFASACNLISQWVKIGKINPNKPISIKTIPTIHFTKKVSFDHCTKSFNHPIISSSQLTK